MIDIRLYLDPLEAQSRARKALGAELFRLKDVPVLLLLSGGSAFQVLEGLRADMLPLNMMVGMLDERYSADPKINNFGQFLETDFYVHAGNRAAFFLDSQVNPEEETLEEYVVGLEQALRDWKAENPTGRIVVTQGMGADGHTAGIMPFPEDVDTFQKLFETPEKWVVGYDAGEKNKYPKRATVTLSFLRDMVDFSLLYITGNEKAAALKRVWEEEGTLADTPARIVREMKNVTLITTIDLN